MSSDPRPATLALCASNAVFLGFVASYAAIALRGGGGGHHHQEEGHANTRAATGFLGGVLLVGVAQGQTLTIARDRTRAFGVISVVAVALAAALFSVAPPRHADRAPLALLAASALACACLQSLYALTWRTPKQKGPEEPAEEEEEEPLIG